jgi:DNA polymerase I-like protein with 3'-5' exonuclease and polymerase domains
VAQSGGFDSYWLWYKDRIRIHQIWFDTLLAHHTLYPTLPHSLAFLTSQYTDHPYYKDEGKDWQEGGDINEYWEYNVKDCCITLRSQQRMLPTLEKHGLLNFFFDHVMRIQPHLVRMTVRGVPIDVALKSYLAEELSADLSKRQAEIVAEAGRLCEEPDMELNIGSPKQMRRVMFTKLRMVGRGTSTDKENRTRIRENPRTPPEQRAWLESINDYKEDHKFLTTYVNAKIDPDSRVRSEYKQFGTQNAPGRLSSTKVMWGTGMNLQNQPERMYPSYHSGHPHYRLVYFDLEQAEARVVAMEAGIDEWKEQFEKARFDKSYDCHRALASDMFEVPYNEVPTKDRDESGKVTIRFIAKRCRHGLNYRMGPDKLASTTGLPLVDATRNYYIYHAKNRRIKKWWEEVEKEAVTSKRLYNAMGRRLIILGPITPDSLQSIVAFKPQSLVGDWVNRVIYMSEDDEEWPDRHARILLNVHDALIALAHKDHLKRCLSIMRKHAEHPIEIKGEQLIIPASLKATERASKWMVERDEDGTPAVKFYEDDGGLFRWSNLTTVEL